MVWESLERENGVAGVGSRMWQADHVEGLNSTPGYKSKGKGNLKKGGDGMHSKTPFRTSPSGPHYAYWKQTNGDAKDANKETGSGEVTGKRKALGVQAYRGRREGKRYRLG